MEKMRRCLAWVLILCLAMGYGDYFSRPSFAVSSDIYSTYKSEIESTYTEEEMLSFKQTIDDALSYQGRNADLWDKVELYRETDISMEEILYYLDVYKNESIRADDRKRLLNPHVYKKYKVVAYEDLSIIEQDQMGHGSVEMVDAVDENGDPYKEKEYRYLGYAADGTIITNDFYPADFKSGTPAESRTYKTSSEAPGSWAEFNDDAHYGQIYQLMNTPLLNDDETDGVYELKNYTAFSLLKLSGFPSYSDVTNAYIGNATVQTAQSKMVMMQYPSLGAHGQFKLIHGTNRQYYDTFRTQDMTLKASVSIAPDKSVYFIEPDQETVTIGYWVHTTIDDGKTSLPYSNGLNITNVDIKSDGQTVNVFSNPVKVNKNLAGDLMGYFTKTIAVKNLDLTDGTDEVSLKASSEYTDMTNYKVAFASDAPAKVKICAASDFAADFTIHDPADEDVTEGTIILPDLYFKSPVTVTLKDASVTEKGNIISREWFVLEGPEYKAISSLNETAVAYTVTAANRASVLHGNKLNFKLIVKTDLSQDEEIAIHEVTFAKEITAPSGPVAIISAKLDQNKNDDYVAMEGQVFDINGRESYHPEGIKLVDYKFKTNGGYVASTGSKKNDYIYYLDSATYSPELTVTDANGGKDTDTTTIRVRPAEFVPIITVEGTQKENRKVSIRVENDHSLRYFPVDESSLDWTITPLDGQGDVVRVDGAADGNDQFDVLFKKKGRYRIDVSGEISSGYKRYSGSASTTITIVEDVAPVADFTVSSKHVRDVTNDNTTVISIYDNSHSRDGDYITQHKYWYRYDDDNDGDFTDTDWMLLSGANYTQMTLLTDQVGKYQFKVEVKEGFGQPTISKFITDVDYKRGNTDSKADADKMTEMINITPTVNLDIANKKPVHLIVYHDYDTAALTNFKNQVEILKAKMLGKQLDLSVDYLTPTEVVGTKDEVPVFFDTYLKVTVWVRGWDEDSDTYSRPRNVLLLLASETLNESGSFKSNAGRYKINSVSFPETTYSGGVFDTDKSYTNFEAYRNLTVQYTDTWANKSYSKTYKFVTDYLYYTHYSNVENEIESKEEYVTGSTIIEDEATTQGYQPDYNDWDAGFYSGRSYDAYASYPREYTIKTKNVCTFKESDLLTALNNVPEGGDTYFLNLASKEVNRLALNETLLSGLKSKNAHYLTLESQVIPVNPVSGQFEESYVGESVSLHNNTSNDDWSDTANENYVIVGNRAYALNDALNKFVPMGSAEAVRSKFTDQEFTIVNNPSIYTLGYTWQEGYSIKYATGLNAITAWGKQTPTDVYSWWRNFESSGGQSTGDFSWNYLKTNGFYQYMTKDPSVEEDGSLVKYNHYYNYNTWEMEYRGATVGTGYTGLVRDSKNQNLYCKLPYDSVTKYTPTAYFYANENGNIYVMSVSSDFPSTLKTHCIITEGVDNIKKIVKDAANSTVYIITDNDVVRYNIITGARTVLVTDADEILGTSAKIGENKWQVGETIYEGYKELYSSELTGTTIDVTYISKNRLYHSSAYNKTLIYIDENDDLYLDQEYTPAVYTDTYAFHKKTLIASDVKTMPMMKTSIGIVPVPTNINGALGTNDVYYPTYMMYLTNSGLLKSPALTLQGDINTVPVVYVNNGGLLRWYSNSITRPRVFVSLENGKCGLSYTNGSTYLNEFSYANLTVGSSGAVVGDNKLIGISSLSQAYATLNDLMDGIYNAYSNYSNKNDVYVLLGDNIEVTMLYDDYESDEAYSMLYDFEHVNPNYFEHSLGKDPAAGTGLSKPLTTLNYVGHYEVKPKVKDNPKADDRFDDYRLENEDEVLVNVYVHRRPIALMDFRFGENTTEPEYLTLTCTDNGSYDLDHESAVGKGIANYEFAIKSEEDASWTRVQQKNFTHMKIKRGVEYKIVYRVQDIEGAWSLPLEKNFKIDEVPINLTAKVKSKDTRFSVDAMPIT
ncbi:MAG: hypothetical protein JXO44_14405, partial [Clostridia bacterium]|nr:hypothetical protein [Clostridia bacterium]